MEPTIYFIHESPDWNNMLERGREGRIAANRVAICVMSEYGLCNDRKMSIPEFRRFIGTIQMVSMSDDN